MKLLHETQPACAATEERPASGPSYRVAYAPDGAAKLAGNPANMFESLQLSVDRFPDRPALGWRPTVGGKVQDFTYMTYKEMAGKVAHAASAFAELGVAQGGAVGVYAANAPEWMIAMKGIDRSGNKCVPLYDTFGADAVKFIIEHSGAKIVLVNSGNLAALASVLPALKQQLVQVVVWGVDSNDDPAVEKAREAGVPVTLWSKFLDYGSKNPHEPTPSGPEDLCTVMYTSGTTGEPKGVELTHRAVLATVAGLITLISHFDLAITEEDVFLSYLPLAHIFDRVAEEAILAKGGAIGYWQGNVKTLMDDVGALRPTVFVGVPRIFDRIYSGVNDKVNGSGLLKKTLFHAGLALKAATLPLGVSHLPVLDSVIFGPVRARLGGRVKVIVSGGAPLAHHVEHFLKATMGCPVTQGYGLTESCGASCVANPNTRSEAGTVGAPVAGLEVKLEAVPDMGYDPLGSPPRGELLVRGETMFTAYHKREDLTSEAVDSDGWFHTGDVAEFTAEGALRIVDRLKNFFKLAHGEYVAAEKLENAYKRVTLVDQIWVYGDSERAQLVSILVPSPGPLKAWAEANGQPTDLKELCNNAECRKWVQQELEKSGRADGLKGFEIVKAVHLTTDAFTVDNDLMTPSFKLKRPQLKKAYKEQLDAMYSTLAR